MSDLPMNKLTKWEGWKKEIGWIIFLLFILFIGWSYNSETKACKEIQKTECYSKCAFEEGVRLMQEENPGLQFFCNETTRSCMVSGVAGMDFKFKGGINITINESIYSNNSFPDTF